jgi:hypothetical protein
MDFGSGIWNGGLIGIPDNIISVANEIKYTPTF